MLFWVITLSRANRIKLEIQIFTECYLSKLLISISKVFRTGQQSRL